MSWRYVRHHRPPGRPEAVLEAHRCPVPGCPVLCSPGHVVCRLHWRAIPQAQRAPLIEAFRRRVQDPYGFHAACQLTESLALHYAALARDPELCALNAR